MGHEARYVDEIERAAGKDSILRKVVEKAIVQGMSPAQMKGYIYNSSSVENMLHSSAPSVAFAGSHTPGNRYAWSAMGQCFKDRTGRLPEEDIPYLFLMGWTPQLIQSTYVAMGDLGVDVKYWKNVLTQKQWRRVAQCKKKDRGDDTYYNVYPESTTAYTTKEGVSAIRVKWTDIRVAMHMTNEQAQDYIGMDAEWTRSSGGEDPGHVVFELLRCLYTRTVGSGYFPSCRDSMWGKQGMRGRALRHMRVAPNAIQGGNLMAVLGDARMDCMTGVLLWGAWKLGMYAPPVEMAYSILSVAKAVGLLEGEDQHELEGLYRVVEYQIGHAENQCIGDFRGYYMRPSGTGYFRDKVAGPLLAHAYEVWGEQIWVGAADWTEDRCRYTGKQFLGGPRDDSILHRDVARVLDYAYPTITSSEGHTRQSVSGRHSFTEVYDVVGYLSGLLQAAGWIGDVCGYLPGVLYGAMREKNMDTYEIVSKYMKYLWEKEPNWTGPMDLFHYVTEGNEGNADVPRAMSSYMYLLWWIAYRGATEEDRARAQRLLGDASMMEDGKWTAVPWRDCWEKLMYLDDSTEEWELGCMAALSREAKREWGGPEDLRLGGQKELLLVLMMCMYSTLAAEGQSGEQASTDTPTQYSTQVMKMLKELRCVPDPEDKERAQPTGGDYSQEGVFHYSRLTGIQDSECGTLYLVHLLLDSMSRQTVFDVVGAGLGGRLPLIRTGWQDDIITDNLAAMGLGYQEVARLMVSGEGSEAYVRGVLRRLLYRDRADNMRHRVAQATNSMNVYGYEGWDAILLVQSARSIVYMQAEEIAGVKAGECTPEELLNKVREYLGTRFPQGTEEHTEQPKDLLETLDGKWGMTGMTTLMPRDITANLIGNTHRTTDSSGRCITDKEGHSLWTIKGIREPKTWKILPGTEESRDSMYTDEVYSISRGEKWGAPGERGGIENIIQALEELSQDEARTGRVDRLKRVLGQVGEGLCIRDYEEIVGMVVPEGELWGINKDKRICIIGGSMYRNCWAMNFAGIGMLVIGRSSLYGIGHKYEEMADKDSYYRDKWVVLSLGYTQYDDPPSTRYFSLPRILVVPDEQWDMMVPLMEHGMVLWPEILAHKYLKAQPWPGWNGGWGLNHCYGEWTGNRGQYGYTGSTRHSVGAKLLGRVLPAPNMDIRAESVGGIYIPRWYTEHMMEVMKRRVVGKGRGVDPMYKGTLARMRATFQGGFLGRGIYSPDGTPIEVAAKYLDTIEHIIPITDGRGRSQEELYPKEPLLLYKVLRREVGTIPSTYMTDVEYKSALNGKLEGDKHHLSGMGVRYMEKESIYMLDILEGLRLSGWLAEEMPLYVQETPKGMVGYETSSVPSVVQRTTEDVGLINDQVLVAEEVSAILRWKMWDIVYNKGRGASSRMDEEVAYIVGNGRVLTNGRGTPTEAIGGEPNNTYDAHTLARMAAKVSEVGWIIGKGLKTR